MDVDKVNAFLATAIGGLLFKWLAGVVKTIWQWLNKTYPEEIFITENLNISPRLIRMSYCKYSKNIKGKTKRANCVQASFGAFFMVISLVCIFSYYNFVLKNPIQWIGYTDAVTNDNILIKPGEARNPGDVIIWRITPETCLMPSEINAITAIKEHTKDFICQYMLLTENKDYLAKVLQKNSVAMMAMSTIIILSIIYIFSLGSGMIIDVYITKRIMDFNKKEEETILKYIT